MSGSRTFQPLTREALEEHEQILFHLDRLAGALDGLDADPVDAEILDEVAVRIDSLRERVDEHFRTEDGGGLFQALVDELPEVEETVHGFMEQHDRIAEALAAVAVRARRRDPGDGEGLRREIESVIDSLREHEAVETALFRRALESGDLP